MRIFFYVFLCLLSFAVFAKNGPKTFTIMLDPAGDAQNTGCQIDDYLERGITLQFCQKLKKELEEIFDNIRVVLTRFPGESIEELQNANFANRLGVDFYLSIHFYKEKSVKPQVYIYTFASQDDFIIRKPDLYFYPYDKAHLINKDRSNRCANIIKDVFFEDKYAKLFSLEDVFALPFKPLVGIVAPAVAIQIGLRKKNDWKGYSQVFVDCIGDIINAERSTS